MTVQLAEQILLEKFKKEPFHNLYLLNKFVPKTTVFGGTCSDKTMSYLSATKAAGLDAHLHSARINGQDVHRLVRLEIDNRRFFADIGNGWPSIQLYSAETPIEYECYGMQFKTKIDNGIVSVFHRKRGIENKQMEVDIEPKDEIKIIESIRHRFTSNTSFPLHSKLRFSMIVGKCFLFIRSSRLEIYSEAGHYDEVKNISRSNLRNEIEKYFGYDIKQIESQYSNL